MIVEGTVVSNEVVYEDGPNGPLNIHTLTTIAVSRTFKGEVQETVTVTGYGGVVGDISHNWPGVPRFKEGEKAVLFLFKNLRGELTVTGLEQGRMTIIDKPGVGRVVTQTFARLKFGGVAKSIRAPAPRTLDEVVKKIEDLVVIQQNKTEKEGGR